MTYTITLDYGDFKFEDISYNIPFPNICHASFTRDVNVRLHLTDLIHIQIK